MLNNLKCMQAYGHTEKRQNDFFESFFGRRIDLRIIPNFIGKDKNAARKNYGVVSLQRCGIKLFRIV